LIEAFSKPKTFGKTKLLRASCPLDYSNLVEAESFFDNWIKEAESSGIQLLKKFADTLVVHRAGILNYFNHFITTGKLEGLNNWGAKETSVWLSRHGIL